MSYPVSFTRAVYSVLREEGGYSNDPRDSGRATKYGISQRAYPMLNIEGLTQDAAIEIYYTDYWLKASCDKLPAGVAAVLFDAAVNLGVSRSILLLQKAVGVVQDGAIGPKTIAAASVNPAEVIAQFTTRRILHYASLSTFKTFGKGWVARAVRTAMLAT